MRQRRITEEEETRAFFPPWKFWGVVSVRNRFDVIYFVVCMLHVHVRRRCIQSSPNRTVPIEGAVIRQWPLPLIPGCSGMRCIPISQSYTHIQARSCAVVAFVHHSLLHHARPDMHHAEMWACTPPCTCQVPRCMSLLLAYATTQAKRL